LLFVGEAIDPILGVMMLKEESFGREVFPDFSVLTIF
jgi:hypothetical protein